MLLGSHSRDRAARRISHLSAFLLPPLSQLAWLSSPSVPDMFSFFPFLVLSFKSALCQQLPCHFPLLLLQVESNASLAAEGNRRRLAWSSRMQRLPQRKLIHFPCRALSQPRGQRHAKDITEEGCVPTATSRLAFAPGCSPRPSHSSQGPGAPRERTGIYK